MAEEFELFLGTAYREIPARNILAHWIYVTCMKAHHDSKGQKHLFQSYFICVKTTHKMSLHEFRRIFLKRPKAVLGFDFFEDNKRKKFFPTFFFRQK